MWDTKHKLSSIYFLFSRSFPLSLYLIFIFFPFLFRCLVMAMVGEGVPIPPVDVPLITENIFFYWVCLNTTFSTITKKNSNIGLVLVFGHIFIDEKQNTWQAEVGMNNGFYKIV